MTVVFYISGHGFGHATRDFEVIRALHARRPSLQIIIRSSVPRWFVERSLGDAVDLQPAETDTGVVQIDSLRLDEAETARRAAAFYQSFADRVSAEAAWLRHTGAGLVVSDMPPLAFAAAAAAGVPAIALGNFSWDWIYEAYPAFHALAPGVIALVGECYAASRLALRMPFHGGFATMPRIVDVPLVARRSRLGRDEARRILEIGDDRPIVLASFGGHGAELPYAAIAAEGGLTLLLTEHEARSAGMTHESSARCISDREMADRHLQYEDLVAAADAVVSKPGYGIVSECIANDTALLYTSRGHFAENEILVSGMKPVLRTHFIDQDDLRAGRWQPAIDALLNQPAPRERMAINGATVVADALLALLPHGPD